MVPIARSFFVCRFTLVLAAILELVLVVPLSHAQNTQPPNPTAIDSGILIVNGAYTNLPYVLNSHNDTLVINGAEHVDLNLNIRRVSKRDTERGDADHLSTTDICNLVQKALRDGQSVFLSNELKPIFAGRSYVTIEFLQAGSMYPRPRVQDCKHLFPFIAERQFDPSIWQGWINNFTTSNEVRRRIAEEEMRLQDIISENFSKGSSLLWEQSLSFPVTVLAMAFMAYAVGHVLANRPADVLTMSGKVAWRWQLSSLTIVMTFSALDLLWTIVASQRASMRELNPMGATLIHTPINLFAFKLLVCAISIGIFYRFWESPFARIATWWVCVVLSLLTARWLVFNSLFLA